MRTALTKRKTNLLPSALLTKIQNPIIIQGAGISVRFTAHNNQLDTTQIFFDIYSLNQRLTDDTLVLYGQI